MSKLQIGYYVKGSDHGVIVGPSLHILGWCEEEHKISILFHDRDSEQVPSECKS